MRLWRSAPALAAGKKAACPARSRANFYAPSAFGRNSSFLERSITMKPVDIKQDLAGNSYPGRGIVIGQSADGKQAVVAYFIMGRSDNSRNRVFADGARRHPHRSRRPRQNGRTPASSSTTRCGMMGRRAYRHQRRPDRHHPGLSGRGPRPSRRPCAPGSLSPTAPTTPPASPVLLSTDGSYELSILKSRRRRPRLPAASISSPSSTRCQPGLGHFIHTYKGDGSPLPSFEGEPAPVSIEGHDRRRLHRRSVGEPQRRITRCPSSPAGTIRPGDAA